MGRSRERRPAPTPESLLLAARLSLLNGVSRDEACRRAGVSRSDLLRARRELGLAAYPTRHDLVLAALTDCGRNTTGEVHELASIASYVDWQNHDGSTAEDVRQLIDDLIAQGTLAIENGRFRLLRPWP